MDKKAHAFFLLIIFFQILVIALSNKQDMLGLKSLKNIPPSWNKGSDPCVTNWEGLKCNKSTVTSIKLSSMGLEGQLAEDTGQLSELNILDLSYNKGLTGQVPQSIGNLKKLQFLILTGSGFSGKIPGTIGSLPNLRVLSMNSNYFEDLIPPSIGNLKKLLWLDLTDNNIEGPIPLSTGDTPGFDKLHMCKHFHLGKNKLTGPIPDQLFSSNMSLIHLLLDNNKLSGTIPSTIGLVRSLEVIDMSNNGFEASEFPQWYSTLSSLKTLVLDDTNLQGKIPADLFSLPNLETVRLRNNMLNGALEIRTSERNHLKLIDLQKNLITEFKNSNQMESVEIILVGNTICDEPGPKQIFCNESGSQSESSYVTGKNCGPNASLCSSGRILSPRCACAYPYTGTLFFVAPPVSNLGNTKFYKEVETFIVKYFHENSILVDSVSLSNPAKSPSEYLEIRLEIFPYGRDRFSRTEVMEIGSSFSNLSFIAAKSFGVLYFISDYADYAAKDNSKWTSSHRIAEAAGCSSLVLLLLLAVAYIFLRKRREKRRTEHLKTLACCVSNKSDRRIPQLKGARLFSFKELKTYTKNFSEENKIGSGGYGEVYLGALPTGELIAIKRAKAKSTQGEAEFITEIELLSRVHHKNLVSLVGFCSKQREQMLIYEYVPNGTLYDSLSGKSKIQLSWVHRLTVALDTAKGLAYLHEFADPPIVHRDIKSANILLDDRLNAKVADFGLCKLLGDGEKDHVSTQVKGTAGYVDPEYYMTHKLTERSDVYSFGVLMLELITARKPIYRGRCIVEEVRTSMDKTKDLYNLQAFIDPAIGMLMGLNGFGRFLELAMRCLDEAKVRPTMSEVVKEIETIMELSHLKPSADSTSTFLSYEGSNETTTIHPYGEES